MVGGLVRPRPLTLTCSLLALALVLATAAGCGGSSSGGSSGGANGIASKTPAEILAAAKAAADGASTVHVAGSVVNAGTSIALDMDLLAGKGGRGRLAEDGLSFELIEVGSHVYITGSPAFYRHFAGPAAAQLLQGKWLKASATSGSFASLSSLTDMRKLLDSTLSSHGSLTRGATSTIAGQRVIAVRDRTHGGTLYVAATGTPYPIEIAKGGGGGGRILFTRWNAPVTVRAPANSVDLGQLESGR